MTQNELIATTVAFVKKSLENAEGGHDWFHIERVYNNALLIAKTETVNTLVVSLAALLHDIADAKFHDGDESIGPRMAKTFLDTLPLAQETVVHIGAIIQHISYKSSLEKRTEKPFSSKELEVVQDADRLDAIGAIGIARAFNYGGFKNRTMYNPAIEPKLDMTKEEYKNATAPTLNHFYEKLLLLKDKMNTQTGRRMAEERHQYMVGFLGQFKKEWGGVAIED